MFNKLYVEIKKILKENYKFIISLVVLFFVLTFKLPYYISAPGGIMNVSDKISISNSYKVKGSFNLAYVSEFKATILTWLYSLVDSNWDLVSESEEIYPNETEKLVDYRNHLLLEEANQNAIYIGFKLADEYTNIINRKVIVAHISIDSNNDLKIGDEIIELEGKTVSSKKELNDMINNYNVGDELKIKVINDNKEYIRNAILYDYNGKTMIGIMISEIKEVDTNRNIKFNFKESESGPSGGLMMALSIYNLLTEEDITHGLKIVGTGTIDEEGNVGSIGGIKYKIIGASKEKADIFFVPSENYEEALEIIEKENININLVSIKNIQNALDYLNNL